MLGSVSMGHSSSAERPPSTVFFSLNETFPFTLGPLLSESETSHFKFSMTVVFPTKDTLPFDITPLFYGTPPSSGTFSFTGTLRCTPGSIKTSSSTSVSPSLNPRIQENAAPGPEPSSHPPKFYFDRSFYAPLLVVFQAIASLPSAVISSGEAAIRDWIAISAPITSFSQGTASPPPTENQPGPEPDSLAPYSYGVGRSAPRISRDLASPTSLAVCAAAIRKAFVNGAFVLEEVIRVIALMKMMDGPEGTVYQLLANEGGNPDPGRAPALAELLRLLSKDENIRKLCFVQE